MDRNCTTETIARRVFSAIVDRGSDVQSVAQAADITTPDLTDRLEGRVEFEVDVLVRVGGFLRIPVTRFMEVAA